MSQLGIMDINAAIKIAEDKSDTSGKIQKVYQQGSTYIVTSGEGPKGSIRIGYAQYGAFYRVR